MRILTNTAIAIALCVSAAGQSVVIGNTVSVGGTVIIGQATTTPPPTGCSGYSVNSTQQLPLAVGGSDISNFLFPIRGSDASPALQTAMLDVAHGGQIHFTGTNAKGRAIPLDAVICTGGGTVMRFVWGYWDGSTPGNWTAYVLIPTYHAATNDSIVINAGNATSGTDQEDFTLFSSLLYPVDHFYDMGAPGSISATDLAGSTNGTLHSTTSAAGSYGGAANLSSAHNITFPLFSQTDNFGWEALFNYDMNTAIQTIVESGNNSNEGYTFDVINGSCGSDNKLGMAIEGITCGGDYAMTPGWHHGVLQRSSAHFQEFYDGEQFLNSATAPNPYSTSTTTSVGSTVSSTLSLTSPLDELLHYYPTPPNQNWINNRSQIMLYENGSLSLDSVSYTQPTKRQQSDWTGTSSGSPVSFSTYPLTSGGVAIIAATVTGDNSVDSCNLPATPPFLSSSLLTYTLQRSTSDTGHTQTYHNCLWTAPITTSGIETISFTVAHNISVRFIELKHATLTGAVFDANAIDPYVTSANNPADGSYLMCFANGVVDHTVPTYTTSWGRRVSHLEPDLHPSQLSMAEGIVAAGSQSCEFHAYPTFLTIDNVLAILPSAP